MSRLVAGYPGCWTSAASRCRPHISLGRFDALLPECFKQQKIRYYSSILVRGYCSSHGNIINEYYVTRFIHPPSVAWPPPHEPPLPEVYSTSTTPPPQHKSAFCDPLLATPTSPIKLQRDGNDLEIPTQIQIYAPNHLLAHPLVSPVMGCLKGLCPLLVICSDMESLRDEVRLQNIDDLPDKPTFTRRESGLQRRSQDQCKTAARSAARKRPTRPRLKEKKAGSPRRCIYK